MLTYMTAQFISAFYNTSFNHTRSWYYMLLCCTCNKRKIQAVQNVTTPPYTLYTYMLTTIHQISFWNQFFKIFRDNCKVGHSLNTYDNKEKMLSLSIEQCLNSHLSTLKSKNWVDRYSRGSNHSIPVLLAVWSTLWPPSIITVLSPPAYVCCWCNTVVVGAMLVCGWVELWAVGAWLVCGWVELWAVGAWLREELDRGSIVVWQVRWCVLYSSLLLTVIPHITQHNYKIPTYINH